MSRRLLRRAVGRQAGVGVWGDVFGRERLWQLDQRAGAGQQVLRVAAVCVDAGKAAVVGVHVVAAPAGEAMAARDERMTDDGVANLDAFDGLTDGFDPASVFVSH